jgi:hypothetical protein
MTQSITQPSAPIQPMPTSTDMARAQLNGVLSVLLEQQHIQAFHFRDALEPSTLPAVGITVLVETDSSEHRLNVRRWIRHSMEDSGVWVEVCLESNAEDYGN